MIQIRRDAVLASQNNKNAYDALYARQFTGVWTGQTHSRYLWLLSLLKAQGGQALLDVSSGNGFMLKAASEHGLCAIGIEISAVGLAQTAQRAPGARAVCGDAEALPFADNAFDRVSNIGSLEHYLNPAQGVAEMARVLKPDGWALVLLPNAYGLIGNIHHVWRHGDVFVDEQPLQRYATRLWWARLLEENGLRIERVVGYDRELPRTWDDLRWLLRRPLKLLRALLAPLIPLNLADCFVFLCRRNP
jgi:SAM-dependent methyltransferase